MRGSKGARKERDAGKRKEGKEEGEEEGGGGEGGERENKPSHHKFFLTCSSTKVSNTTPLPRLYSSSVTECSSYELQSISFLSDLKLQFFE